MLTLSVQSLFKGLYKRCECGRCNCLILIVTQNKFRKYKHNHHQVGENGSNWNGGKTIHSNGYILIFRPDHPSCSVSGYVPEHRLVYEEYYNCCLLSWIDIHHINKIKTDNRIENLQPIMRSQHCFLHHKNKVVKKKDMSDRKCSYFDCKDPENKKSREWLKDGNGGWLCKRCARKRRFKLTGK